MNIYDVARQAGVSIATVSRVINGRGNVSEKTRRRVCEVIQAAGYTPNGFARGLGLGTMRMVGVMCADVSDIFYARAVSIIENELRAKGYDAILCCTGSDLADKQKAVELLLSKQVDAIILVGSVFKEQHDNSHIERAAAQVPVIIINGVFDIPGTYCMLCDEEQAVADAVHRLAEDGRSRILYLYESESFSGMTKLAGYRRGLQECGLAFQEELVLRCERRLETEEPLLAGRIRDGLRFDAVIGAEDILTVGAVHAATACGLRVPEDVAAVGFNNSVLAQCCTPSLTSVDNKVQALCTSAVRALIDVFEGREVSAKTVLSTQLVYRDSFPLPLHSPRG